MGDDESLAAVPSLWDELPSGPRFGTLVHSVLEVIDPAGDEVAIRRGVLAEMNRTGPAVDVETLTAGLRQALATPLSAEDSRSLREIARQDRLCELDFELPLAGGDEPGAAEVMLSDLVPVWRDAVPDGPLADYAQALAGLEPAPLRGYLTGSIDAVLRIAGESGPRYLVVDYKTNRLGVPGEPLTIWDYRPEPLRQAMIAAHYPLQALLYSVALHRFLRWRQPGYDPDTHLGETLYLFLRGMPGLGLSCADGAVPGVFRWKPPTRLVTGVSDLLAGR